MIAARTLPPEPAWRTAVLARAKDRFGHTNCGALARVDLQRRLAAAGQKVSLVVIHTWTRGEQGRAYLWAIAYAARSEAEREDFRPPVFVERSAER
jgi:hypothetical protein